jgi:hypothetical protein
MDNNQDNQLHEIVTNEQMLAEILENTRKTKNYMKWQMIITIALVVLPILAIAAIIPMIMNSLGSIYGGGDINNFPEASSQLESLNELLK